MKGREVGLRVLSPVRAVLVIAKGVYISRTPATSLMEATVVDDEGRGRVNFQGIADVVSIELRRTICMLPLAPRASLRV